MNAQKHGQSDIVLSSEWQAHGQYLLSKLMEKKKEINEVRGSDLTET